MTVAMALSLLALGAYWIATAGYVIHLLTKKQDLASRATWVLIVGLTLHALAKALRFAAAGGVPVTDAFEAASVLALVVGAVFIFAARRYRVPVLGAFAVPLVAVTLAASLAFGSNTGAVPAALRSAWFPIHLACAIGGDAFFALAGVASVAWLVQERLLREKRLGTVFHRLPPLHLLDELSHRMISVGFLLMTLGIASGSLYAKREWGSYWQWDPKQTWSLMTWLLFAGILHARLTLGWRGRRAAWLTAFAVVCVLAAMFGLGAFAPTRHGGDYGGKVAPDVLPGLVPPEPDLQVAP